MDRLIDILSSFFTAGPVSIIFGFLGLGAVVFIFRNLTNWMVEKGFQSGVDSVSRSAGQISSDLNHQMEANDVMMDAKVKNELEKQFLNKQKQNPV